MASIGAGLSTKPARRSGSQTCRFKDFAAKSACLSNASAGFGILPRVTRMQRNPVLYCLLAMMFVVARTADAHAHLCSDGKEPPAAVHVADGDVHPCETDTSQQHQGDQDIQLSADVVAKKPAPSDAWIPCIVALDLLFIARPLSDPIPDLAQTDDTRPPLFRVPPLRGPPA